jgi:hypothetical protein
MTPNWKRVISIAGRLPTGAVKVHLTTTDLNWIASGELPNAYYNKETKLYQLAPCDDCLIVDRYDQWIYEDLYSQLNFKEEVSRDQSDCSFHFNSVLRIVSNYLSSPEIRKYRENRNFNDFLKTGVVNEK